LSRFRYINHSIGDLLLGIDITVLTRTLTLDELSEKYTSRLDLILIFMLLLVEKISKEKVPNPNKYNIKQRKIG